MKGTFFPDTEEVEEAAVADTVDVVEEENSTDEAVPEEAVYDHKTNETEAAVATGELLESKCYSIPNINI